MGRSANNIVTLHHDFLCTVFPTGLPPNVDSIQTEVATVCAMCQLVVLLQAHFSIATKFTSEWSIQHCNTLIGRSEFVYQQECIHEPLKAPD